MLWSGIYLWEGVMASKIIVTGCHLDGIPRGRKIQLSIIQSAPRLNLRLSSEQSVLGGAVSKRWVLVIRAEWQNAMKGCPALHPKSFC